MDTAIRRAGRQPEEVLLVAVSKGHSVESIAAAYAAGHRDFGENRADEMMTKVPRLPDDIRWHFVGALQSRKARLVRPRTWLLHSLDRPSLLRAWVRDGLPVPPALVQVNIAREPQKHGVDPDEVATLVESARDAGIECRGLMILPPAPTDPEDSRPWFRELVALQKRLRPAFPELAELSMGMTDDFEVAISEGASVIRVGRAIFGPRNPGYPSGARGI
ncbi:MAG TPA: YggS family pyridoxal phosphate-dependent enzyme [Acidimicrobiia bacterium]|nr:YggS family pyridoxal phosphate-dependent enzyme [Acidimicrobiia bacterium]